MNTPSWQAMGLTTQSEFQAWVAQLLEGFTFPKNCMDELPALAQLAVAIDSMGEIKAEFRELEAALTSDFLPSFLPVGQARELNSESSHQAFTNYSPNSIRSDNLQPQNLIQQFSEGENIAHLSQQKDIFNQASQRTIIGLGNGWNGLDELSSFLSTESLPHRVVYHKNAEIFTNFEYPIDSSAPLGESLPKIESSSISKKTFSNPEMVTQESNFSETDKKSARKSWITVTTVTPIAKNAPIVSLESMSAKSQLMVDWIEPEGANSTIDNSPINRSPLPQPPPTKSLGDLANLLSFTPTQALDWQEDVPESEMKSDDLLSQDKRKAQAIERGKSDAVSNIISDRSIAKSQPMVDWIEPEGANSTIDNSPINRSPLPQPPPTKSLGDLANLLSFTPTQALDWQEDVPESEMKSDDLLSQDQRKAQAMERGKSDAVSNIISDRSIEVIAPMPHFPLSENQALSAISSDLEAPTLAVFIPSTEASEFDLEEILEALQQRVNQEYRRFYGG